MTPEPDRTLCRHRFRSSACGYLGHEGFCGKTFADCRRRGNAARFGGEPPPAYRGRFPGASSTSDTSDDLDGFRGILAGLLGVLILALLFWLGLFL
jgi:hypothetical protein